MSRKNNVNPDHYKTAGRDRPNEVVLPEIEKKELTTKGKPAPNFIPGAAPAGESPKGRDEDEQEDRS
jgi:hypothetical protein